MVSCFHCGSDFERACVKLVIVIVTIKYSIVTTFKEYVVYESDVFGDHAICCGAGGERLK